MRQIKLMEETVIKDLSHLEDVINEETRVFLLNNIKAIQRISYKKYKTIIKEGEKGEDVFLLISGFAKVFKFRLNKNVFIRLLKPGDFLGFALFSDMNKYPYSVITLENCVVYHISKEMIDKEFFLNPYLIKTILNFLNETINMLYEKIVYLRCKQMNGRIADALLHFSKDIFASNTFDLPFTRQQFGEFTHVSPENVTRILKGFEKDKLIKLRNKHIIILNKEGLEFLSEKA